MHEKRGCRCVLVLIQQSLHIVSCLSVTFSAFPFVETKMPPHVGLKTRWIIHSFTNIVTCFSFATCDIRYFFSTTRSVRASGEQWMMGRQGPMVPVVPTFPPLCFIVAEKTQHFLLKGPVVWNCHVYDTETLLSPRYHGSWRYDRRR